MKWLVVNNKTAYNLDCIRKINIVSWGEDDNRITLYYAGDNYDIDVMKDLSKEKAQETFEKVISLMKYDNEDMIFISAENE